MTEPRTASDPHLPGVLSLAATRPSVTGLTEAIASLDGSPALAAPRVRLNLASYGADGDDEAQEAALDLLAADRQSRAVATGWLRDPSFDGLRRRQPVAFTDVVRGIPHRSDLVEHDANGKPVAESRTPAELHAIDEREAQPLALAQLDAIGERAAEALARQGIDGPVAMLARLGTAAGRKAVAAATGHDEAELLGWAHLVELALLRAEPGAFPPAKPPAVAPAHDEPGALAAVAAFVASAEAFWNRVTGASPRNARAGAQVPDVQAALAEVNLLSAASIASRTDLATWTDIAALRAAVSLANAGASMLSDAREQAMLDALPAWQAAAAVDRVYWLVDDPPPPAPPAPATTDGTPGDATGDKTDTKDAGAAAS